MLEVYPLAGDWRIWRGPSISGMDLGLWDEAIQWGVLIPPRDAQSYQVAGFLMESDLTNQFGDRTVIHTNLHGKVTEGGDENFSSYSVECAQPTGSTYYIGDPVKVTGYEFITQDGTVVHFSGIVTVLGAGFTMRFPDHTYVKRRWNVHYHYRNVRLECKCSGTAYLMRIKGEQAQDSATVWTKFDNIVSSGVLPECAEDAQGLPGINFSGPLPTPVKKFPHWWWTALYRKVRLRYTHPISDENMYGDLVRRAVDDAVCLGRNNIEFLTELPFFVESLKDLYTSIKQPLSLKMAAGLYLSYKYGPRLTIADALDNIRDLKPTTNKKNYSWVRAQETVIDAPSLPDVGSRVTIYHYKVYYDQFDSGPFRAFSSAWNYGLFPTLQNAWDLIPLSFVVDWFTDTQEQLSVYDARTFWSTQDVLGSCFSKKEIFEGMQGLTSWSGKTSIGQIDMSRYIRNISPFVHQPCYLSLDQKTFKNYLEGTALLVVLSKGK